MRVLGVVENMSGFVCPKCKVESDILPASSGGAAALCEELGLKLLGRVPLDPSVGRACDEGRSLFEEEDGLNVSHVAKVYKEIVDALVVLIDADK